MAGDNVGDPLFLGPHVQIRRVLKKENDRVRVTPPDCQVEGAEARDVSLVDRGLGHRDLLGFRVYTLEFKP